VVDDTILLHSYQKILRELSEATEDIRKGGDLICILPRGRERDIFTD
jgi:1-acyl-sn-glycerol-3-phosphate acyltransferase